MGLFDIRQLSTKMLIPRKDYGLSSGERIKTEGYTEDFESPLKSKKNWEDWFGSKDGRPKEENKADYVNENYIEEEEEEEEEEEDNEHSASKMKLFAKSFFSKDSKPNALNSDYVNIFEDNDDHHKREEEEKGDDDHDELNESSEFCEKLRNETLKVNSHPTHVPKTIAYIVEKLQHDPSSRIYTGIDNQSILRESYFTPGQVVQTEYDRGSKLRSHLGPEIPLFGSTPKPKVTGDLGKSFDKSYDEINLGEDQKSKRLQNYSSKVQNLTGNTPNYNQGSFTMNNIRQRESGKK